MFPGGAATVYFSGPTPSLLDGGEGLGPPRSRADLSVDDPAHLEHPLRSLQESPVSRWFNRERYDDQLISLEADEQLEEAQVQGQTDKKSELEKTSFKVLQIIELQIQTLDFLEDAIDLGLARPHMVNAALDLAGLILKSFNQKADSLLGDVPFFKFFNFAKKHKNTFRRYIELILKAISVFYTVLNVRDYSQIFALLKLTMTNTVLLKTEEVIEYIKKTFSLMNISNDESREEQANLGNLDSTIRNNFSQFFESKFQERLLSEESLDLSIDNRRKFKQEFAEEDNLVEATPLKMEDLTVCLSSLLERSFPVDLILLELLFETSLEELNKKKFDQKLEIMSSKMDSEDVSAAQLHQSVSNSLLKLYLRFSQQRNDIWQKISDLEIICEDEEVMLFKGLKFEEENWHINPLNTDLVKLTKASARENYKGFALPRLRKLISELLVQYTEGRGQTTVENQRKNAESAIEAVADITHQISQFLKIKQEKVVMFRKTQNLMRLLGFIGEFTQLIKLPPISPNINRMFQEVVNCLEYLCWYNSPNQKALLPFFEHLLNLVAYQVDSSSIIAHIILSIKVQKERNQKLEKVLDKISIVVNSEQMLSFLNFKSVIRNHEIFSVSADLQMYFTAMINYQKIFRKLLSEENQNRRQDIQIKILSFLIETKRIIQILDPVFYDQVKKILKIVRESGAKCDDGQMAFVSFYSSYLSLIGELAFDHPDCIETLSRVVSKPFLREVVLSSHTDFSFKKQWLKMYHFVSAQ
jgi:hypothetical protein